MTIDPLYLRIVMNYEFSFFALSTSRVGNPQATPDRLEASFQAVSTTSFLTV
jgi:hypothetical protein